MAFEIITDNLAFFIFLAGLLVFLYVKKDKLELQGKYPQFFILMYKTRLGLNKMKKWSTKYNKTYLYLAYLCLFVGVVGLVLSFISMFWQLWFVYDNNITSGAGGLVLPIKTEKGLESSVPVLYVPFVYWIIALFILIVVHEFAHGVIAERFKIPVKSSGFAFFGSLMMVALFTLIVLGMSESPAFSFDTLQIILIAILFMFIPFMPAAFVEPDEKVMKKKPWWQQVAVLGAGSTSNFLFGALFLLILLFLAIPFYTHITEVTSLSFSAVMNESDLKEYSISSAQILAVNGEKDYSQITTSILPNLTIGEELILTLNSSGTVNDYTITTFEDPNTPDRAMIGIYGLSQNVEPKDEYAWLGSFPYQIRQMFFWLALLNLGIGLMNLLPLWITDGGQILRVLAMKYTNEKNAMLMLNITSLITFALIILMLWPNLLFSLIG